MSITMGATHGIKGDNRPTSPEGLHGNKNLPINLYVSSALNIIVIDMPASVYMPLCGEADFPQSVAKEATNSRG